MLTFLNSAILIGLTAVALPILIHLFTRQKIKVVDFSSLRFLKELQKQQIRRLKLKQILLLILRALLILALVFAFARPALKESATASLKSGAQLTAIFILDNTLSMGRESEGTLLLEKAKQRALEVLSFIRQGDEIYLLYPQNPPLFAHHGARFNSESVRELIEDTELSYAGTDYSTAFELVDNIMRASTNINKEVYLIGDLQRNGLRTTDNGAKYFDQNVKLFVMPVTEPESENLSISDISVANQILEKDKVMEIEAVVNNHSPRAVKNKLVHLFVNGKRVAQNTVDLAPGAAQKIVFRMVPDRTGQQSGYVLLEDDDLLEDNRRFFTFTIPDQVSVLLVGNRREDTALLTLALNPEQPEPGRVKYKQILSSGLNKTSLENYNVVALSNIAKFENVDALKIRRFVEAGGGLLVFLGADVDIRNYNQYLHSKLNVPLLTESITSQGQDGFLSLGKIDFSHAIFRNVFDVEKNVVSPHFRFVISVQSDKPMDKIIEFSNGMPFLFESSYRKGRILYFTSGLSNDWSDLPVRGLFVPLVNRAVTYLAGYASENDDDLTVGQVVSFSPEESVNVTQLTLEAPDGTRHQIKPEITKGRYFVHFPETDLTGVYKLINESGEIAKWAVNYDPAEADHAAFEIDELRKTVGTEKVAEITQTQDIAEALKQSRFGRELWKYFAFAALVLIIAEMVFVREKAVLEGKVIS
ncbi:MAG: BatA domain-containing protein [bacterium]